LRIGRNDSCPCGSERKYKNCCLRADEERRRAEEPGWSSEEGPWDLEDDGALLHDAAGMADAWQIDLVPIPISFDDDPAARPCFVLIAANGLVVHSNLLTQPASEPAEVAAQMAREVLAAAQELEAQPRRIMVRRRETVAPLRAELAAAGCRAPVSVGPLDDLDEASAALRASMGVETKAGAPIGCPITWAGWGLPASWCAEAFAAAATFYRAAPWKHLWDADLLTLEAPSGRTWAASVMGRGGDSFGLVLYADPDDFERVCGMPDPYFPGATPALQQQVVSLLFGARRTISPAMRKEIAREGWEVAGPAAYPYLVTMNALAGGITRQEADDLVAALVAVAAFAQAHGPELDDCTEGMVYRHPDTATIIELDSSYEPSEPDWLEPGGATGPGAQPEAALDEAAYRNPGALIDRQMELVERFHADLRGEALGASTVRRHTANATLLVQFLGGHQGVPLAAMHEYDLRLFLYDWVPLNSGATLTAVRALPTSLRRFFHYLADDAGIDVLLWAEELLADRDLLEIRYESCPVRASENVDLAAWRVPVWMDLEARLLLHDGGLGADDHWGRTMGLVESLLEREVQRRWLLWREALLQQGIHEGERLYPRLVEQQRAWEASPHAELDGKSPIEAITAERAHRAWIAGGDS
jgi:hypothetical protein